MTAAIGSGSADAGLPPIAGPLSRARAIGTKSLKAPAHCGRSLAAAQLGRAPCPESSILKLVGTEIYQEITELAMDGMGHDALGWLDSPIEALPEHEQAIASQFNYLRAATIYGGSNEIQRTIIAKQILRLPSA